MSLFAWLALLVLSGAEGQLLGGRVTLPFLLDIEAHARFLLVMPLLIASELVVHLRMRPVARLAAAGLVWRGVAAGSLAPGA